MKCRLCGIEMESDAKFCPNCGAEVTEPESAAISGDLPETSAATEDTISVQPEDPVVDSASDVAETAQPEGQVGDSAIDPAQPEQPTESAQPEQPVNPYAGEAQQSAPHSIPYGTSHTADPGQNPYANSASQNSTSDSYYGMPQYNTAAPQYAGAGVPPKKKKKVWPWVLGICLGIFVILVAIVVIVIIFASRYVAKDLKVCDAAQNCAYAIVYTDGDKFCEQLPEEFLSYLETTYEINRDGLEDQLDDYLGCDRVYADAQERPAPNGMKWISDYWATDDVFYSHDMPEDVASDCTDVLSTYGMQAEEYALVSLDEEDTEEALCAAKIGDNWYIVDSMMLADELCSLAYGKDAQLRTQAQTYLNAVASRDTAAMQEMVPDVFWTYLERDFDCDAAEATFMLEDYLQDTLGMGTIRDFSSETEDPVWYYQEDVKTFNIDYDYGMTYDYCVDIECPYTLTDDDGPVEDAYTVTLVEIDGTWYAIDAMMDYVYACYLGVYGYYDYNYDADRYDDFFQEDGDEPTGGTIELPDPNCETMMDAYFAALSDTSAAEMSALVPDSFWAMVQSYSGMSQNEAEGCMTFYLLDLQGTFDRKGVQYTYTVTATDDYSASECLEMNEYMEPYGLDGESYTDVWMELTVLDSDGQEIVTDEIYLTFTRIDGTWYLYDAMYDYLEACELYADTAGNEM